MESFGGVILVLVFIFHINFGYSKEKDQSPYIQLESWIKTTSSIQTNSDNYTKGTIKYFETIFCDESSTSIWAYKYVGPKHKKLTKLNADVMSIYLSPKVNANGFDYGLKSGVCLKLYDDSMSQIFGTLKNGQLEGRGTIYFINGTYIKANFFQGFINSAISYYKREIDEYEQGSDILTGLRVNNYFYEILQNNKAILIRENIEKDVIFLNSNISIKCIKDENYYDILMRCKEINIQKIETIENKQLIPIYQETNYEVFDFDIMRSSKTNIVNYAVVDFIYKLKHKPLSYFNKESIFTDLSLNNGVPIISDLRYLGEVETSTIYSCFNLFDGHNQTFKTSTRNLIGHATLKFISNDSGIAEIRGILKKRGIFHGNLKIILKNDTEIEAIAEDNYINGLVRTFKRVDNMDGKVYYGSEDVNLEIMGVEKYRMGKKTGPSYYFIPKSESLIFKRDETSDEKVYIPSALINSTLTTTCYQGKFIGNTLLEGILVSMTGFITEDKFIIPLFKPLQSESQSHNEPLVYPLLEDIVEHDLVYVNLSSVGGEGLFAKEDIPKGTIFAYYGGYRISIDEWEALSLTYPEYWIKIMEQNEIIYLPDELGMDTSRYKATLAHKINHSFENFNSYFKLTSHPKYKSMIPGVEALTFIPKGTEILCFYNDYFYESNPWFQDLWKQYYDDDEKNDHAIGLLGYGSTPGEPIKPMLSDIKLYKEFENYALTVLKLSAFV
ncbi:uncharacterized protein [Lepeophtheirus salmonis]|uniref:uncharacterized protein n=1 Tax=Lepeophtheirus salmonis TaxID=72036 RepID=UPI001AE40A07|nr:uncharacterized protein LOC121128528 [Lepeophtheirus salmonis]